MLTFFIHSMHMFQSLRSSEANKDQPEVSHLTNEGQQFYLYLVWTYFHCNQFFPIFEVSKWQSKTSTYVLRSKAFMNTKNMPDLENQNRGNLISREALYNENYAPPPDIKSAIRDSPFSHVGKVTILCGNFCHIDSYLTNGMFSIILISETKKKDVS